MFAPQFIPLFANIQLEATVVSIVNFIFVGLFVYCGIRQIRNDAKENTQDYFQDPMNEK